MNIQTTTIQREIEAAKVLREQIAVLANGDEDFIRDAIEGETGLLEMVAALVANEGEDKALLSGLDTYQSGLEVRRDRIKKRIELRRTLIASALEIAGRKKLETPSGTAALTAVRPTPIIQDEGEIPSKYWKQGQPTLDRKALSEDLKAGVPVPGATLSNGGQTVTIRRN